jgi:hypothetical protein
MLRLKPDFDPPTKILKMTRDGTHTHNIKLKYNTK